jgi:mono/diheme cytochrome c family protein
MRKLGGWLGIGVAALVLAIQLVPYGRDHRNPAVRREPVWDSPETRALAVRACFDCHSNETVWPWYSTVAPVSWFVVRDVAEGRRELNLSEWDRSQKEAHESAQKVKKGTMPPWYYPWARLSPAEREALIRGLEATLGTATHGRKDARAARRSDD